MQIPICNRKMKFTVFCKPKPPFAPRKEQLPYGSAFCGRPMLWADAKAQVILKFRYFHVNSAGQKPIRPRLLKAGMPMLPQWHARDGQRIMPRTPKTERRALEKSKNRRIIPD